MQLNGGQPVSEIIPKFIGMTLLLAAALWWILRSK
jgi:hypothetical protein